MNYEKAYKEALERAKLLKEHPDKVNTENHRSIHASDYIFPELEEAEDEKIRKFLIDYFECLKSTYNMGIWKGFKIDDIISYIGRQKEQNPVEWSEEDERIYQSIMDDTVQENQLDDKQTKWLSDIKYRYFPQSNQEWNEDDEKMYNVVHDLAWESYRTNRRLDIPTFGIIGDWLKSLKDRVQPQPKQEWSEEDERLFQIVIDILDRQNHLGNISTTDLIACVKKLKSLKPQTV